MWNAFFSAIALVFIFEGTLPFLSPTLWRQSLKTLLKQSNISVRLMGFLSMMVGVILLHFVRSFVGE